MGGGYSSYYQAPTESLKQKVARLQKERDDLLEKAKQPVEPTIIEKDKVIAIPFTIHKCSKLTADDEGLKIWADICTFVNQVTNKVVQHKEKIYNEDGSLVPYEISETCFYVPEGDVEAIIHDMCHWIVSTDEERKHKNCKLGDFEEKKLIYKEELAWTLETWLFSAVIGEPELVDLVSPHAEIETFHYWVRLYNPVEIMMQALTFLQKVDLNVTVLRRLLASWIQWKEKNPSLDAQPRGCLGWGSIGLPLPVSNEVIFPLLAQPKGWVSSEDIRKTLAITTSKEEN